MEIFDLFLKNLPFFLKGVGMTFKVLICCSFISISLGMLFGILTCERLKTPIVSHLIGWMTFILRAIPFYVQLLIVYFVFPDLFNINLDAFTASIIGLGFCSSGYVTQIIRSGINSIPISQWESTRALGYNQFQTLYYVILPQMLRNVLPALNNEFESLLKSTSVLASIGLLELTRVGINIISRELQPLPIYFIVATFYVSLSVLLNFITKQLEKRVSYVKSY